MKIPPPSSTRAGRAAFSLIEVTLAMAIAAVAVVSLLAMVPQGMNTMRAAGDEAIMGRIHQQVLNELQMADFDNLDNAYKGMEIYYDAQGEEIGDSKEKSTAKGSLEHIYTAKITVPDLSGGRMPESVGGASTEGLSFDQNKTTNNVVRPVVIEVAAVSGLGENFRWDDPEVRHLIEVYQSNVVKMGQNFKRN